MRFRTYREAILHARSDTDVVRIVRDAIGTFTEEELKALPDECRNPLLQRDADIHSVAVTLLHCDLRHRGERDIGDLPAR